MEIKIPAQFTLDDLLALTGRNEIMEGWYTAREWAAHFGVSVTKMRNLLRAALQDGLAESGFAFRVAMDGISRQVSVYAFKAADEAQEADGEE